MILAINYLIYSLFINLIILSKEFYKMPQKYRKLFKYGAVVATVSRNKKSIYEVK